MAKVTRKKIGKDETKPENQSPAEVDVKKLLNFEKQLLEEHERSEMEQYERARNAFQQYSDSRRRYDWEWLSRDLFRRGYQFTRYNSQTRTVTLAVAQSSRIPINLTQASMRVIRNQVTAFRPKWEVLPNRLDDEAQLNARYSGKLLDYVYKIMRLKKHIKETVSQGLLYSVGGFWQIGWDKNYVNEDGSKGMVYIWTHDPFDCYVDQNCTDGLLFSDAEGLIKAVRTPVNLIKTNQEFNENRWLVKADNRVAASEYKQFLLQSIKFIDQYRTKQSETAILYEGWFKERNPKTGKVKMRVLHWVDSVHKPLKNQLIDREDYPFLMYQADMNPLEVYGESWAKHVIPINRVMNILESSEFDYNYKYNKGRILMDKNSGVRIIDNQQGTIIEKNRGSEVRPFPLAPLSGNSQNQIVRMRQYFEDVSGAHDVSLGRIPVGVKSGIGIAELKQADATNQDDLVDNLQDFLVEVARKVLKEVSKNITTPRLIRATNIAGEADYFAVLGEKSAEKRTKKDKVKIGKKEYPLAIISEDNSIDVQIGSWLAYSKQQRQQELKDLYATGVIDQRTLLEHLEFGDIEQILQRTRKESIIKKRRELQKLGSATDVTEEELARAENELLLEGNTDVMALPQDDHRVHIVVHEQYNDYDLVRLHIQEHEALLRQQAGLPQAEIPEGAGVPMPTEQGQAPEELLALAQEGQLIPVPEVAPVEEGMPMAVPEVGAVAPAI